jgi:adenylate cyclase, class 2
MANEIEAKMKVADLELIRQRLVALKAVREGTELETNIFFDLPDAELRKAGKGLRIRVAIGDGDKTHCTMTFKGPLLPGELKTREEIEFSMDNAQAAQLLLERLGFVTTLSFEKRRETWQFEKCKVELDLLPLLGTYVEIEGPGDEQVLSARKALGLTDLPLISTAYVSLLAKHLQEHGIRQSHIGL